MVPHTASPNAPPASDPTNYGNNILTANIQALATDKTNMGFDENINMPVFHSMCWSHGAARVCCVNQYVFEHTHVSGWQIGWARLVGLWTRFWTVAALGLFVRAGLRVVTAILSWPCRFRSRVPFATLPFSG